MSHLQARSVGGPQGPGPPAKILAPLLCIQACSVGGGEATGGRAPLPKSWPPCSASQKLNIIIKRLGYRSRSQLLRVKVSFITWFAKLVVNPPKGKGNPTSSYPSRILESFLPRILESYPAPSNSRILPWNPTPPLEFSNPTPPRRILESYPPRILESYPPRILESYYPLEFSNPTPLEFSNPTSLSNSRILPPWNSPILLLPWNSRILPPRI